MGLFLVCLLTSDLVDWSSISESLGSTSSWNGGRFGTFLRSGSSHSCRDWPVCICNLSLKSFLPKCWASRSEIAFPDKSANPFLRFLVRWSSPSGLGRCLLSPESGFISSARCSLDKVLDSLKPILELISLSGWFSLGLPEESLEGLLGSQTESLKALLGSFKSFRGFCLWSLEDLWSLEKLALLVLVAEVVVRKAPPPPLEWSCGWKPTNYKLSCAMFPMSMDKRANSELCSTKWDLLKCLQVEQRGLQRRNHQDWRRDTSSHTFPLPNYL